MDWTTIASFLAGLASGFALKIVIDLRLSRTSRDTSSADRGGISQTGNRAGGDVMAGDKAGRDIKK